MSGYNLLYSQYNSYSILIEWPSVIDESVLKDIISFKTKLQEYYVKQVVEVINTYNSLLIIYDSTIDNVYDEFKALKSIYVLESIQENTSFRLWKIPVCYGENLALDLDEFAIKKGVPKSEIIALHSQQIYTVFFIGFLPGFLYLGGLDSKLYLNRKSTPNPNIKKGSVAIGGKQTGIYPQDSPGGWHIIGNSPLDFFNSKSDMPCFAKAGDKIQFVPINQNEHKDISMLIKKGSYRLESEVIDG